MKYIKQVTFVFKDISTDLICYVKIEKDYILIKNLKKLQLWSLYSVASLVRCFSNLINKKNSKIKFESNDKFLN